MSSSSSYPSRRSPKDSTIGIDTESVVASPSAAAANTEHGIATAASRHRYHRSKRWQGSMAEPTMMATASPAKSPARRHAQRRSSLQTKSSSGGKSSRRDDDDDDDFDHDEAEEDAYEVEDDDEEEEEEDDVMEDAVEEEEPLKMKRIIASRTETKRKWLDIGKSMNTSEIHYGSRWFQQGNDKLNHDTDDPTLDTTFEERFLVVWSDLSYLHTSWETHQDLVEQADGKIYLTTFFRKAHNGLLYTPDERCDGDYFDPAYCQVERILEVQGDANDAESMVLDKEDPQFDNETGRQLLVKWEHLGYTHATYEFERDLVLNEIEYTPQVQAFLQRNEKPRKKDRKLQLRKGEDEYKRLYRFFGDKSPLTETSREQKVEAYKTALQDRVYKNGGQVRDYQAEGIAWMIANFCNQRSCALCDEMGLGKTLQTAAAVDILLRSLHRGGPVLIVAPLSTLAHWYREFQAWTDLNAIVYHGSAEDRDLLRQHEFVYECDRPPEGTKLGFNQLFLKWCAKRKQKADSPWMVDVVITTPETMVLDDVNELYAVQWELLVVDEAQKLKNYNSKLAMGLRDERFSFRHKILLTGTPIQNDMQEFWTLLNFMDPGSFDDMDEFLEQYGREAMQSKERLDALHEEIRPYLLRRLKEDVEKSVPPKEETLIEVELTLEQKTYYRALYEKNVKFLHKNKKRALDAPSLNNLAMQLRKCCNHLFLLNGVEEEFRKKQSSDLSESDVLAKASGKLVLLDKLLPRLKEEGHRILIFSQFKIMLDVLEDYLQDRQFKFERIDGSITGMKRQQAIDRFQAKTETTQEPPFIMMLSTRAGGVGINLTAADTCIIFDSDWNPQNDLQAQARCHRIGQTKPVKIYRLLTRKTYEMQMFHMSSLKMGLDQAVLTGFEGNRQGESTLSKDEVEKLLRHGAYDIFSEDQAGEGEAASNEFVQQDIDSILQRHSRTVVHENTGSKSTAVGGTFSKASFKARSPDGKNKNKMDDVDIEDPDFWKKMIGEASLEDDDEIVSGKRQRTQANYSEQAYKKQIEQMLVLQEAAGSKLSSDESDSSDDDDDGDGERTRWGGSMPTHWGKDDVERLIKSLSSFGYGNSDWTKFVSRTELTKSYPLVEVTRMCWSIIFYILLENAQDDAQAFLRREAKATEKAMEIRGEKASGVLAQELPSEEQLNQLRNTALLKYLHSHGAWLNFLFIDATTFAEKNAPRKEPSKAPSDEKGQEPTEEQTAFFSNVWPSLESRGWAKETRGDGKKSKTVFAHGGKQVSHSVQVATKPDRFYKFKSIETVLESALQTHPELDNVLSPTMDLFRSKKVVEVANIPEPRIRGLILKLETISFESLVNFVSTYSPLQLVHNRKSSSRIRLPKKVLSAAKHGYFANSLVAKARKSVGQDESKLQGKLASLLDLGTSLTLSRGSWSTSHDAILVLAVAKHGWIEQDSSVRSIVTDQSLKWGPPFDSLEAVDKKGNDARRADIISTARRVVDFLNEHSGNGSLLEGLKNFSTSSLQQAYALVPSSASSPWFFEIEKLLARSYTDPVDLPPKKDLIRRAKQLLSGKKFADSHTEYATIDQSSEANLFLCEILRALLREPQGSKNNILLCEVALKETRSLADSLSAKTGRKKETKKMNHVIIQIETVRKHLSGSVRQYRNLLRVMLGEELQRTKKLGDPLFPPKPSPPRTPKGKTKKPTGEEAIEKAQKRRVDQKLKVSTPSTSLHLTEIETLILSSAISYGIPVWTNNWEDSLAAGPDAHGDTFTLDWSQFGQFVVDAGDRTFQTCRDQLVKVQTKHAQLAHMAQDASSTHDLAACQTAWECAQQKYVSKENVLTQAKDYCKEPETLAKKTAMLLAKVWQTVSPIEKSDKSDNGLGSAVVAWMGTEIRSWARVLDLLDGNGQPLAFTAIEFLDELPEEERTSIEIASVFDKTGCRYVFSQISLLSRLRSLASAYHPTALVDVLENSLPALRKVAEKWQRMPEEWGPNSDAVLLYRLLEFGLSNNLLSVKKSYPPLPDFPAFSNKVYRLSKGELQLRANQLVRELHSYHKMVQKSEQVHPLVVDMVSDDEVQIIEQSPSAEKRKSLSKRPSLMPSKKQRVSND